MKKKLVIFKVYIICLRFSINLHPHPIIKTSRLFGTQEYQLELLLLQSIVFILLNLGAWTLPAKHWYTPSILTLSLDIISSPW